METKISGLEDENNELKNEREKQKKYNNEAVAKISGLNVLLSTLNEKNKELENKNEEFENKNNDLEVNINKLEIKISGLIILELILFLLLIQGVKVELKDFGELFKIDYIKN